MDEDILSLVQRPGRYIGGEKNLVRKERCDVDVKVALAFPDTYEVGMSHLGIKILYGILNDRNRVAAERVFSPWLDMEAILRQRSTPLSSLETQTPLRDFDIVGFSLQSELNYTNVLNVLDLGGIPLRSDERTCGDPLVIAGGPCCFNPEPMADFIDLFVVGEAEEAILEVVSLFKSKVKSLKPNVDRAEVLSEMAKIEGVYVPSLYVKGISNRIKKRVVSDLDKSYYPTKPPVPYIPVVHDRMNLEIMRGCKGVCRFCQAGVISHPRRERSLSRLVELAKETFANTGYEEMSLLSLSSGDHSEIEELLVRLNDEFCQKGVAIALPSLRIERGLWPLPSVIAKVRKTGLTFAPEVGSDRLRSVINKPMDTEALLRCVAEASKAGWRKVKLYFMIGLPTETHHDLDGICEIVNKVSSLRAGPTGGRLKEVGVSIAPFVPKPHTSFQREPMMDLGVLRERGRYLVGKLLRTRGVNVDLHHPETSYLEAALARGDRRLGQVIFKAWQGGAKFDGWTDQFRFDPWKNAFEKVGLDPGFYVVRKRPFDEILPWDHIDPGVKIPPFVASQ